MRETLVWYLGWEDPLEEGMATYSSILAWRIPMDRGAWQDAASEVVPRLSTAQHICIIWCIERGRETSMFMRERNTCKHTHIIYVHICCCLGASLPAQLVKNPPAMQETWDQSWVRKMPWKRKWLPTLVFLSGKSHGQWSLAGYSPWGHRVRHDWATNTICCCLVAKSCLTFYDPMNYSPPGSSVHGSSQARKLERVAISFYRGSSQPRDWTTSPALAGGFFTTYPQRKPMYIYICIHMADMCIIGYILK